MSTADPAEGTDAVSRLGLGAVLTGTLTVDKPAPRPIEWRYVLNGRAHLYRSVDPRAFPVCGTPTRYSNTTPVYEGDVRCGHCDRIWRPR